MRIKLCGINNPELAKYALNAGADLIGIVLTPTSRRYVPITTARIMVKAIQQENSTPVLVFRDEPFSVIAALAHELGDCIVQFQGGKRDDIHKLTAKFNSIVAFSAEEFVHAKKLFANQSTEIKSMLLIDSQNPGSGKTFCWQKIEPPNVPWLLAGGLHSENVRQAIEQLNPTGVDVSTGIENNQGKKDLAKILAFIRAVRN